MMCRSGCWIVHVITLLQMVITHRCRRQPFTTDVARIASTGHFQGNAVHQEPRRASELAPEVSQYLFVQKRDRSLSGKRLAIVFDRCSSAEA